MDSILQAFLSWEFVLFSLGIGIIMFMFRKIINFIAEKINRDVNSSKFYAELVLPFAPILVGVIFAIVAKQYPFPDGIKSISGRILFGLVAGGFSSTLYRVVKGMFKAQLTQENNIITGQDDNTTIISVEPGGPGKKQP